MLETDRHACWRVDRPDELVWASFDSGAAVYHRPSGKTHFLNASSVAMLELLQVGPADAAEVCAAIGGSSAADPLAEHILQVSDVLRNFERVGLIQRSQS